MATAFITVREGVFGGEVEFHELDGVAWICDSWKLKVQLPTKEFRT